MLLCFLWKYYFNVFWLDLIICYMIQFLFIAPCRVLQSLAHPPGNQLHSPMIFAFCYKFRKMFLKKSEAIKLMWCKNLAKSSSKLNNDVLDYCLRYNRVVSAFFVFVLNYRYVLQLRIINWSWTKFIVIIANVCVFLRLEEDYWDSTGFF